MGVTFDLMVFGSPFFLWALTALAIPIAIHLLRFRPAKKIFFSDIRLLESIETESRSMKRLRHWLLLLMRLLALSALILAFAQPEWRNAGNSDVASHSGYSILLDPSLSMQHSTGGTNLHIQALEKVRLLLETLPENQEVGILSGDGNTRLFASSRSALNVLTDQTSFIGQWSADETVDRWFDQKIDHQLFIFGDLQQSDYSGLLRDSNKRDVYLIPVQGENALANLRIDSVWLASPIVLPGVEQTAWVRIINTHDTEFDTKVELNVGGRTRALMNTQVPSNGQKDVALPFIPDTESSAYVEISDDGFQFDNRKYFRIPKSKTIRIWVWDEGEAEISWEKLFKTPAFSLALGNGRYPETEELGAADLIVLADWRSNESGLLSAVEEQLDNGADLLVWPDAAGKLPSFAQANLQPSGIDTGHFRGASILIEHPVFRPVIDELPERPDLPEDKRRISLSSEGGLHLISYDDGNPMLLELKRQNSTTWIFASSLNSEWSEWKTSDLIIPILLNTALLSRSSGDIAWTPARQLSYQFLLENRGDMPVHLTNGSADIIPEQISQLDERILFSSSSLNEVGFWYCTLEGDTVDLLGLNADPSESDVALINEDEMHPSWRDRILEDDRFANELDLQEASPLWPYFLWAALIFLFMESLISRFAFGRAERT